ncbi:hypothetical protein U1Q18_045114 [Sarracenia purpurea var. burkii]
MPEQTSVPMVRKNVDCSSVDYDRVLGVNLGTRVRSKGELSFSDGQPFQNPGKSFLKSLNQDRRKRQWD